MFYRASIAIISSIHNAGIFHFVIIYSRFYARAINKIRNLLLKINESFDTLARR